MKSVRWPVAATAIFGGLAVLALAVFGMLIFGDLIDPAGETAAIYWMCALSTIILGGAWLLLVVWCYVDADRRGMNAPLWAISIFILNFPLGPIVYLVFRRSEPLRLPDE